MERARKASAAQPDVLAKIEANMARGQADSFYLRKGDGLRWHKETGRAKGPGKGPPEGYTRYNAGQKLEAALATKTSRGRLDACTFTAAEWDGFGPFKEELLVSHYVQAGDAYYTPAQKAA